MRYETASSYRFPWSGFAGHNDSTQLCGGGDAIFKKSCVSCHYTDGPAKEKTIADQLAKKGPELWYAGSKFQKDWLAAWLQNPKPIRPLKYNSLTEKNAADHPKSSAGDAAAITDFLMGLTSPKVAAGKIKAKVPRRRAISSPKKCHAADAIRPSLRVV